MWRPKKPPCHNEASSACWKVKETKTPSLAEGVSESSGNTDENAGKDGENSKSNETNEDVPINYSLFEKSKDKDNVNKTDEDEKINSGFSPIDFPRLSSPLDEKVERSPESGKRLPQINGVIGAAPISRQSSFQPERKIEIPPPFGNAEKDYMSKFGEVHSPFSPEVASDTGGYNPLTDGGLVHDLCLNSGNSAVINSNDPEIKIKAGGVKFQISVQHDKPFTFSFSRTENGRYLFWFDPPNSDRWIGIDR